MRRTPGKRWRHIILNTHGSWLHGDPRGFRDHHHRVHSTGDYRNPPPAGEHSGLHDYMKSRSGPAVRLPRSCLPVIGTAIRDNLAGQGHDVAAIAVDLVHAHLLVELPDNVTVLKKVIGWSKYFATRAARSVDGSLDAALWAEGETYKPVDTESHWRSAFNYIKTGQGADAWVWAVECNER